MGQTGHRGENICSGHNVNRQMDRKNTKEHSLNKLFWKGSKYSVKELQEKFKNYGKNTGIPVYLYIWKNMCA